MNARNFNLRKCEINTLGGPSFAKEYIRHGFGLAKSASSQLGLLNDKCRMDTKPILDKIWISKSCMHRTLGRFSLFAGGPEYH